MNWWWVLAAATIAGPWDCQSYSVYYYDPCCRPITVYCPCTPVYVQAPIETPQAVAVEKVVAEEEVAEAVGVRETVLDPVGFRLRMLNLPDLALDWGLATIGPGTLYPTSYALSASSGFFPGWGNGVGNGFERSIVQIVQPQPPTLPPGNIIGPGPDKPPPGKEPVPEPGSIVIWTLATLGGIGAIRRMRGKRRFNN